MANGDAAPSPPPAGVAVEIVDEVVRRLAELKKFDFGTAEEVVKKVKQERGLK